MSYRPTLSRLPAALALTLGLTGFAQQARAVNFVLTDIGTTQMTAEQRGAFQAAADYWSSKLTDNTTIYINIAFNDLGANILGSTSSTTASISYSDLRSRLASDVKSATDLAAVASLPTGSSVNFYATQGDLTTRFDNDGSTNNKLLGITTANMKAIGLSTGTDVNTPDAYITFSTGYASNFAYTRVNGGIPSDKLDFITVAEHEIGHALGFVSGVDDIDYCVDHAADCQIPATADRFENDWWYYPLDMFRYSAAAKRDVTVGGSPYFSVDGGATGIASFSTGQAHGNGWQASHFGTDVITLMRPYVQYGQSYDATAADLMAFDAIGWDLAVAVPEPSTYALMFGGLAFAAFVRRRQQRG